MAQDRGNQTGRPVWVTLLAALTAAGLAFCALAILIPPLAGAWAKPFAGAGDLAGWTFLWTAAIMLIAAQMRIETSLKDLMLSWLLLGFPAQCLFGVMFIALGYQGASEASALPFVAWLILPGAAMIVVGISGASEAENAETKESEPAADPWPALLVVILSALGMGAVVLAIGIGGSFGYALYYALEANLIDGRTAPMEAFLAGLPRAFWNGVSAAAPGAIAITIVWFALFSIALYGVPWVTWLMGRSLDQPMTDAQGDAFDRDADRIDAYALAQGYDRYGWLQWAFLAAWFPLFLVLMVAPAYGFFHVVAADNSAREAGHLWAISIREGIGFSVLVLGFAGILLTMIPFYLAFLAAPRWAEISAWTGALTNGETKWPRRLLLHVLKSAEPVDPGPFLQGYTRQVCLDFIVPGLALAAIGAYFWTLDRADYDLLTPDRIETVDYWTSQKRTHRYDDVAAVELSCTYDDGDPEAEYSLRLANGDAVDIDVTPKAHQRLDALTHIDDRLRARGVTIAFDTRTPWFRDPFVAYDEDCLSDLVTGLPPERAAQIDRILHLDAWRARP